MKLSKILEKRGSTELIRQVADSYNITTLDGIEVLPESGDMRSFRIVSKLHQVCLSGGYRYGDIDFQSIFGQSPRPYPDYSPEEEKRRYGKKWIMNPPSFTVCVFLDPLRNSTGYYPAPCRIEISPREKSTMGEYKGLLQSISAYLPQLKVSSAEYAVDVFCKGSDDVARLFDVIKRYLYISNRHDAYMAGEQQVNIDKRDRFNYVYELPHTGEGDVEKTKLYERGEDAKKERDRWNLPNCDRVRLEYTAGIKNLKKAGIKRLSDLVEHPRFYEQTHDHYRLCHFKETERSGVLPKEWDGYPSEDQHGNMDMFMREHLRMRNEFPEINSSRVTVDQHIFEELLDAMRRSFLQFDEEWKDYVVNLYFFIGF